MIYSPGEQFLLRLSRFFGSLKILELISRSSKCFAQLHKFLSTFALDPSYCLAVDNDINIQRPHHRFWMQLHPEM